MSMWKDHALQQLVFWWDYSFWPRMQGLTDEEYLWCPAPDAWTVHPHPDGGFVLDDQWPPPDPPPVTSIAWRLCHIASGVFADRNANHFGGPRWDANGRDWPGTADAALEWVKDGYETWCAHIAGLTDEELARPAGPTEGFPDSPMYGLVLHISRETIHHGAEVCLLRDLYRAWVRTSA